MRRNVSVEEISDGRRYTADDYVEIGTDQCRGCSDCCRMDALILLDPLDVYELTRALDQTFAELQSGQGSQSNQGGQGIRSGQGSQSNQGGQGNQSGQGGQNGIVTLTVTDGLVLPSLNMRGGVCPLLGSDGRCTIHELRPGICRLFPLGRSWENGDFTYILQVGECPRAGRKREKVKKWLGIPDLPSYEAYCRQWHKLLEDMRRVLGITPIGTPENTPAGAEKTGSAGAGAAGGPDAENGGVSSLQRQACVKLLELFYVQGFDLLEDFYTQYRERDAQMRQYLGIL